jgi:hypothetical protein
MITAPAPSALVRRLRAPGYLILGLAMFFPFLDLAVSVSPFRPSTVAWRWGTVGMLSSAIGASLLLLFLIYVLAHFAGDRRIMVVCAVLAALIALLMVGMLGTFALDSLQMKRRVQEAAQAKFLIACAQALMKLVLEGLGATVLAVNIFNTLKTVKPSSSARSESRASASLIMGRASASRHISAEVAAIPEEPKQPVSE